MTEHRTVEKMGRLQSCILKVEEDAGNGLRPISISVDFMCVTETLLHKSKILSMKEIILETLKIQS